MEHKETIKSDVIRYCRRNVSRTPVNSSQNDVKLTINIKEMALYSVLKSSLSIPYCITYFNEHFDYQTADDEFSRFQDFIKEASEPAKSQLTNFLFPLFVHIYLSLFRVNKFTEAKTFHESYSELFLKHAEGYNDVIKDLINFKTIEDVINHHYFKLFWEEKYIIQVSEDTMEYLKSYLQKIESTVLLPILHLNFYIEEENKLQGLKYAVKTINKPVPMDIEQSQNRKLAALKDIIAKLAESSLNVPATCAYTIECDNKNLSAININSQNSLLACAFGDPTIHIISLTSDLESELMIDEVSSTEFAFGEISPCIKNETQSGKHIQPSANKLLRGHTESVYGLCFTPHYDLLVSCSEDTTIKAWSMKTFKSVALYYGHSSVIWDVDVSSYTKYFATASKDGTAQFWDFAHSTPLRTFSGHTSTVDVVRFHPNGNYIATASSDKTIRLWTTQDARAVRCLYGHNAYISSLAFSPNGRSLATADYDGCIMIWDLGAGKKIKEYHGHTRPILSLSFNAKSSVLASGGFDGILKIWDVRNSAPRDQKPIDEEIKNTSPELLASYDINNILHFIHFGAKDILMSFATSQGSLE